MCRIAVVKIRRTYITAAEKSEGKRLLRRLTHSLEDSNKWIFGE
jgi:hypothetical protein